MTSMTRLLLPALLLPGWAFAAEPGFAGFAAQKPSDWINSGGVISGKKQYGNFRMSFDYQGSVTVGLGPASFPFTGEGSGVITADGGRVAVSINGRETPQQRVERTGPIVIAARSEGVRINGLQVTELPPGPAIGENVSSLVPDFKKLAGPKGLFVLFVRSADW